MLIDAAAAALLGDTAPVAWSVSGSTAGGWGLLILAVLAFNLVSFGVIGAATGCIAAVLARGVAMWKAAAAGVGVGLAATAASGALIVYSFDSLDSLDSDISILSGYLFAAPLLVPLVTVAIILLMQRRAAAASRVGNPDMM